MPDWQYCHLVPGSNCSGFSAKRGIRSASVRGGPGFLWRGFAHAGSVGQQVPERQPGRFSVRRLEIGQFRQVLGHGIVHGELALVLEHEHGRCRHRLGHRGDPEEVVHSHGLLRRQVRVAHGIEAENLVLVGDKRHGSGDGVVLDERLKSVGDDFGRGLRPGPQGR